MKYVVTGLKYGNLFRFVNHSCDPNCFIQPVLSTHLDRTRPELCMFAMRKIFPGEEITYDYGRQEFVLRTMARMNEGTMWMNCWMGSVCVLRLVA